MNTKEIEELKSYLLGLAYGGISSLIACDPAHRLVKLIDLESQLKQGIEKIYYSNISES